jgi:TolA-binding protein
MRRLLTGLLPCLLLLGCEGKREDNSRVMAKIQGESFTLDQFELLLNTLPADRKTEILKDSESKRKQFNSMLQQRLFSLAAQDDGFGKNELLKKRLKTVDQRLVTQTFYQVFLGEQGGFPKNELESYFQQHGSSFVGDSGKPKAFETVRQMVADSLIVSKANIDSFYQVNQRKYVQRPYCELSLIEVKSRKTADAVFAEVEKGLDFKAAVAKYSISNSKTSQGRIGRAYPGEAVGDLGAGIKTDSLFFTEATKLAAGKVSKPFKKDSTWILVRSDSCIAETIPPLAKIRHQVAEEYVTLYRGRLNDSALARLKVKYAVKNRDLRKSTDLNALKAYYEKNKESYTSPETYEVYHIESSKRDLVEKKLKSVKDLAAFKVIAAQISENAWTKADSGKAGRIKRDHALPYGIGMLPNLWSAYDTLPAGRLSGPYQNPEAGKWHWFFLVEKFKRELKPFDRAKALVNKDFQDEMVAQIKPQDTLAVYGNKVLLEADVLFLRTEIPPNMQERYTREQLVDYLLTWDLITTESESLGLTSDPKLVAQRLENVDTYWSGIYQDSVLNKTYGQDSVALKAAFAKQRKQLTKDSADTDWRKYARDIAGLATLTPKDFEIEYATNPERYTHDTTVLTMDAAQYDIFQNIKGIAYTRAEKALVDNLKVRYKVEILDPALLEPKITNAQEAYKQAQTMHYDRKLDQALELYEKLRVQFPDNLALQDSLCFGVAQIYIEQERYQQAMAEYRRVSYLYPKSANEYKAEFMVGFIQSEHLKNDSAAVKTFVAMLKKYPSTDLSDDADWMVRNIRSGGKLMPVLQGDSGWVDPDSGKVQAAKDSTKANGVKAK